MEDIAESMVSEEQVQVYAWIVGRLNATEVISNMIFGQFTKSLTPPENGWIFCGRNIEANIIESKGIYASTITVDQESLDTEKKINSQISRTLFSIRSTEDDENSLVEGRDPYHILPVIPETSGSYSEPPIERRDGGVVYANPHLRTRAGTGWLNALHDEAGGREGDGEGDKGVEESEVHGEEDPGTRNGNAMTMNSSFGTNRQIPDSFAATRTETWQELHPFLVEEETMSTMVKDELSVRETEGISLMRGPLGHEVRRNYQMQYISGCSFNDVNGRYLEWGKSAGCVRYRNPKGWVLMRVSLSEIPELGIKAENCYGALDGEPVLDVMEGKTVKAFDDLMVQDEEKAILEGSMVFKEKFATISRFGSMIINYDQTFQLLRNNDLKAGVRMAASRAMLLQLLALKSNEEKEAERLGTSARQNETDLHAQYETVRSNEGGNNEDDTESQGSKGHSHMDIAEQNVKDTEVDVEIETLLSRNTMYQTGSQGFPLSGDSKFLVMESELSREVTLRIETREQILFELGVEAEKAHRVYLESHDVDVNNKNFVMISDLLRKMDALREATVNVAESLGAWTRLCHKQQNPRPSESVAEKSTAKPPREYSVAIAVKGAELYPASEAIVSGVKKYRRSRQQPKVSTDVKYVGLYKKKQEAIDAFIVACSQVPLEKRAFVYGDQPPMYIGLRECGKHYLVRTDGVPSDLPCEHCQANKFSKPNDIVKASASERLPQFLWHGKNYLEKMWGDLKFLEKCAPLGKYFPEYRIDGNPLLLDIRGYFDGLEAIGISSTNPLDSLKGRIEQTNDAVANATLKKNRENPYKFMGTPYVENFVKSLVKMRAEEFKWLEEEKKRLKEKYSKSSSNSPVMSRTAPAALEGHQYDSLRSTLQGDLFDLNKTSQLDSQTGLHFQDEDIDRQRLHRALGVLCQSANVTLDIIPCDAKTDRLNLSVLKQNPLKRPTLPSEIKKKLQQGLSYKPQEERLDFSTAPEEANSVSRRYADSGLKGDFVTVKTSYAYRGAQLSTMQKRPPVANRTDEIWCRTDVGEWKGLTKGRSMRSYEFQERLKEISKALIAERLRMQSVIRKALEIHYADLDKHGGVQYFRALISEAAAIRGTALKLDIAQVELYIQKRHMVIKMITRLKARFHGRKARRRVRAIRARIKWEKEQVRLTEELAYSTAREFFLPLVQGCMERVGSQYNKIRDKCALNISGDVYVITAYKPARNVIRNEVTEEVCMACMSMSSTSIYNPKLHRVPLGVVPNVAGSDSNPNSSSVWLAQGTYGSRRAICTCQMVQEREKVLFKLYNPITKQSFYHTLREDEIRENFQFILNCAKISIEERRSLLVGNSFGELNPVFASRDQRKRNVFSRTEVAKSLLEAGRESSILPLLPMSLPISLHKAISCSTKIQKSVLENFFKYESTKGPITVTDTHSTDKLVELPSNKHWEVFSLKELAKRQCERVEHHLETLRTRADNSDAEYTRLSDEEIRAREEHDRSCMQFEDIRVQTVNTFQKLLDAKKAIVDAVSFSKYGIEKFVAEEKNISLDWAQSHDGFEDGNAWRNLNNQRRLEVIVEKMSQVYVERYYRSLETAPVLAEALKKKIAQQEVKIFDREAAIEYEPTLKLIKAMESSLSRILVGLARNALCRYYIPYSPLCKRRPPYLRKQNIEGVFIRDAMVRCKVENRYLLNLIERRVIGIQITDSAFQRGRTVRVVACYYADPLTGNHLLSLMTEDDIQFEECTMHLDFQFSMTEFSEAISTGVDKEMLLTPHNVEDFVRRGLDETQVKIKTRKPPPVWVPRRGLNGERRLRSIEHVKTCRNSGDRLAMLPKSYAARRKEVDDKLYQDSTKILSSLRLHPYSRRPCLGRLYFDRRQRFIEPKLRSTMWMNNLSNQDSVQWNNEFYENLHFFCGTIVHVVIRNIWEKMEFRITTSLGLEPMSFLYVLSFDDIMRSFSTKPLLLTSFMSELMTNSWSFDSISHILRHIDQTLPGDTRHGVGSVEKYMWRKRFEDNIPVLQYHADEKDLYRGPVYRCNRFMSGYYVLLIVYKTAYNSFRVVITHPLNGKYGKHAYTGEDITITFDWNELVSFCLLLPSRREHFMTVDDSLKLLYSYNYEELFRYIFDAISITHNSMKTPVTTSVLDMSDLEMHRLVEKQLHPSGAVGNVKVSHDKDYVSSRFRLFLRKFEKWSSRRSSGKICAIPESISSQLCEVVDRYGFLENKFSFSCSEQKDSTEQLIHIFQGVWCSPTPLGYRKYADRDTFLHPPILDIPVLSRKRLSYLLVNVLTDDSKETIYLRFKSATLSGKKVEAEESLLEGEGMSAAEGESRAVENNIFMENDRLARNAFNLLHKEKYQELSKVLLVRRRQIDNMVDLLDDEVTSVNDAIESWLTKSKNSASHYVMKSIYRMESNFCSFSRSDVITRDMRSLLNEIIFNAVDQHRCGLCKLTFKNSKQLERHLTSDSGPHVDALLAQHAKQLEIKLARLEKEHSVKRAGLHLEAKTKIARKIQTLASEIEEEKDGAGEYEGQPPITPEEALLEAEALCAEEYTETTRKIDEEMDKDIEGQKAVLITRHNENPPSIRPLTTSPRQNFIFPAVSRLRDNLQSLKSKFSRQLELCANNAIQVVESKEEFPVLEKFCRRELNHIMTRVRSLNTTSDLSERRIRQRNTSGIEKAQISGVEKFRSYNSWTTLRDPFTISDRIPSSVMTRGHIISEPKFGPFDIFSLDFYNPISRGRFTRIFIPPCKFDVFADKPVSVRKASQIDFQETFSSTDNNGEKGEKGVETVMEAPSLERAVAMRVSTFAILRGAVSAAAKIVCDDLYDSLSDMETNVERHWRNINNCGQNEFESFKREYLISLRRSSTEKPSKMEKKRREEALLAPPPNRTAFGIYVPLDEETMPTLFECQPSEWANTSQSYLGETMYPRRLKALPMFVYTRSIGAYTRVFNTGKHQWVENTVNRRVVEWMDEFLRNNGWRSGEDMVSFLRVRKSDEKYLREFPESYYKEEEIKGDVVLIMRFGSSDAQHLLEWCRARYERDQPERERLRELERMRRELILRCHHAWREYIFDVARPFVAPLEELSAIGYRRGLRYGQHAYDRASQSSVETVTPYFARLLLSEYCVCMDDPKYQQFVADAFLIDCDVGVEIEDNFLRFENWVRPPESEHDPAGIFDRQSDITVSLKPTVLQVLYAVLILHCRDCNLCTGTCKFPGCRLYKNSRCFDIPEHFGTGRHILEVVCREYLLDSNTRAELRSHYVQASLRPDIGPDPDLSDEEDEHESAELERIRILEEVTVLRYRAIQAEGAEFRYLNRRMCRQEVSKIVPRKAYFSSLAGEHLQDEEKISSDRKEALERALEDMVPRFSTDEIETQKELSMGQDAENAISSLLIELPLKVFKNISGCQAVPVKRDSTMSRYAKVHNYGAASFVASQVDPYPAEQPTVPNKVEDDDTDGELSKYPMKPEFFNWLLSKLSIQQCLSSNNGQHIMGDINFDRLLGEKTVHLEQNNPCLKGSNGDIMLIQMLYGILPGLLISGPSNGFPDAAVRYYNFTRLSDLQEGITISVYDSVSHFSRAQHVECNTLQLWTGQLGLGKFEISKLVYELLRQAPDIFSINRSGKLFQGFTVEPNRVSPLRLDVSTRPVTSTTSTTARNNFQDGVLSETDFESGGKKCSSDDDGGSSDEDYDYDSYGSGKNDEYNDDDDDDDDDDDYEMDGADEEYSLACESRTGNGLHHERFDDAHPEDLRYGRRQRSYTYTSSLAMLKILKFEGKIM